MAGCRIVNAGVVSAVEAIKKSADDYRTAGSDFVEALNSAISEMEGEAKDALQNFIDKDVRPFVAEELPNAVQAMSELLEANRTNFLEADKQIADSIGSGG